MTKMNIPFFGKDIYYKNCREDILKIVDKIYSSGKVVMGPEVEEFENKIASYCSRDYAVAVGSCTDALYFSLISNGIKKDDEVLVSDFSFIASASCILRAEAIPVFIDINPRTYMMDLDDLENKITNKTKVIVAVDLFGDALDIETIEKIGRENKLIVIEDAAQSIGSRYGERKVGSLGICSCISFDPTKILSAQGNGGVVLMDDLSLYETILKMRYHGKNLRSNEFEILGFNSRISSLQSAILSYNFDRLENWIEKYRDVAGGYIKGLSDVSQIILPKEREETRHVYHKFVMQVEKRDELKKFLGANGIQTKIHYEKALHENKLFENFKYIAENIIEVIKVKENVLSLPIHPWITRDEINYIIEKIREFYKK